MPSAPERRPLLPDLPLSWLVATGYVACLLVTLLLLGLVLHQLVSRYLWWSTQVRMVQQARAALGLAEGPRNQRPTLAELASRDPQELVRALADTGMTVRILDPAGRVLAEAGQGVRWMPLPGPERLEEVRQVRSGRRLGSVSWVGDARRRRLMMVLVPLGPPDQARLFLQAGSQYRFVEELNSELARLLGWTGLVALALGIGASLVVGRLIARPLQRLASTARRVAEGDLAARTGIAGGRSEIRAVASAFDEMVERLEESFAAQARFVADASHELRTPLTAIGGMAELLQGASREERARALATMEREVDRMGRLVDDLLVLSRTEGGSPGRPPTAFDLGELLEEVAESARMAHRGRTIEVSLPGPLPFHGDRDALARAFRNLVDNALKYSPTDTPVGVSGCAGRGAWEVRVRDHGAGVAPEDLPHVFERFYRADRSRARATGGSGLGLAIVRAVVEAHGGRTALRNHPEGGAEVTVTFGTSGNLQEPGARTSAPGSRMVPDPNPTSKEPER